VKVLAFIGWILHLGHLIQIFQIFDQPTTSLILLDKRDSRRPMSIVCVCVCICVCVYACILLTLNSLSLLAIWLTTRQWSIARDIHRSRYLHLLARAPAMRTRHCHQNRVRVDYCKHVTTTYQIYQDDFGIDNERRNARIDFALQCVDHLAQL
jgi:hypothetical protein